ncbi:MAG: hypothetical protein ACI8P9_001596 [Parasphingorhabdus sp.]|jgi:hypothetical protein
MATTQVCIFSSVARLLIDTSTVDQTDIQDGTFTLNGSKEVSGKNIEVTAEGDIDAGSVGFEISVEGAETTTSLASLQNDGDGLCT